jgi:hypothetical protein
MHQHRLFCDNDLLVDGLYLGGDIPDGICA